MKWWYGDNHGWLGIDFKGLENDIVPTANDEEIIFQILTDFSFPTIMKILTLCSLYFTSQTLLLHCRMHDFVLFFLI